MACRNGRPRSTRCLRCSNIEKNRRGREAAQRANTKHGHWAGGKGSGTYRAWESMFPRCDNPEHPAFQRYGGRGIKICARWRGEGGFMRFLADVGERPSDAYSLDRFPDGDGNYEPGNVRWATHTEQMQNRPGYNVNYTIDGDTLCLSEWARRHGKSHECVRQRIKLGWSPEEAIKTPVRGQTE